MMKTMRILAGALLILGLGGCVSASAEPQGKPAAVKAAVQVAQAWLELIDQGAYERSWTDSATYFKSAVSQSDWVKTMRAHRAPLGKLISRKIRSGVYFTELPGAPDGDYVVVQFETVFGDKAHAIETVTPMLDKDGLWRPSGYYIK
jgi:Protein of unknown function (DUF4019)